MLKAPEARPADAGPAAQPPRLALFSGRSGWRRRSAAQLLAIGNPGAGNTRIGGDAVLADIHIGAARPQAGGAPALGQVDPHPRQQADPLLEAETHQTSTAA